MNFTAAVRQLVPQSELPQQQTAAALYCSSLAVTSHRKANTNVSRTIRLCRIAAYNTNSAQYPYLYLSLKCSKRSDNKGKIHELKLSVRVMGVIKPWFQWKDTTTKLWLLRITFWFHRNEADHSNTKIKYLGEKKKKKLKPLHNQVPHHS